MPQMPPGDTTGDYYIPVSGLPWQCSWQKLKDFARRQTNDGDYISVDHAHVYPRSTDGWVRLKNKSDFFKALEHLDGGILEHRALMAYGGNDKEWMMLRDICPKVRPKYRHDSLSSTGSYVSLSTASYLSSVPSYLAIGPSSEWYQPTAPSESNCCSPSSPIYINTQYLPSWSSTTTTSSYQTPSHPLPQALYQPHQQVANMETPLSPTTSTIYTESLAAATPQSTTTTPTMRPQPIFGYPINQQASPYINVPISPTNNTTQWLSQTSPQIQQQQRTHLSSPTHHPHSSTTISHPPTTSLIPPSSSSSTSNPSARKIILTRLPPSTKPKDLQTYLYRMTFQFLSSLSTSSPSSSSYNNNKKSIYPHPIPIVQTVRD